jgi:hypothetical protein
MVTAAVVKRGQQKSSREWLEKKYLGAEAIQTMKN